jgi:ketosteroid isomerase-like protein
MDREIPLRPEPSVAADEAAIMATVGALSSAMTDRDLAAAMAVFEDSDAILLVGSDDGEVFKGRAAVRGFLGDLMQLPFSFSFETPDPTISIIGDTAWMFVDAVMIHAPAEGEPRHMSYRISLCLVRSADSWLWQLFHGSVPGAE